MKNSIKMERVRLNLTQEDLAQKVGVSRQSINAIESNKYTPSTVLALKIGQVLGKKMEDLFELEEGD
jgi:putative transcriptional regulator